MNLPINKKNNYRHFLSENAQVISLIWRVSICMDAARTLMRCACVEARERAGAAAMRQSAA